MSILIRCDLCNVTTSDKNGLDNHLNGARHKLKVEGGDEEGKRPKKEKKVKEEADGGEETKVECSICKVVCPDMDGYNLHIEGEAHKLAEVKLGMLVDQKED